MRIVLFIFLICSSCNSQENKLEGIIGSWYPVFEKDHSEIYFEVYIGTNYIYYFVDSGMLPRKKVVIDDGLLFIENKQSQELEEKGKIYVSNNQLIIDRSGERTVFAKLNSNVTLEDIWNEQAGPESYRVSYANREYIWKKEE
ncbi:hypothetical protein [Spongiimicrobium sp. 3-5]|uniref:hypothetical protein n=1 Tax=Spongiimicrobium sp. 3-5 TaxID=3332596 RepID=UPI00397F837E